MIIASANLLKKRMRELEDLGRLDDTLVIFTSDHGELFGERGNVLHVSPMCPELVYVPTIFIHPDLKKESFIPDPAKDIIEHVDVIQTCLSAIDKGSSKRTEGVNILSEERPEDYGYSHTTAGGHGIQGYAADGIWWPDSGYQETSNSKLHRAGYIFYKMLFGSAPGARREKPIQSIKSHLEDARVFGDIPVSQHEAKQLFNSKVPESVEGKTQELEEETIEHLEDLGYK